MIVLAPQFSFKLNTEESGKFCLLKKKKKRRKEILNKSIVVTQLHSDSDLGCLVELSLQGCVV